MKNACNSKDFIYAFLASFASHMTLAYAGPKKRTDHFLTYRSNLEVVRFQQQPHLSLENDIQADSTSKHTVPRIDLDQYADAIR